MKVYFSASLRQKPAQSTVFKRIVDYLEEHKHLVYERVLSRNLQPSSQISSHYLQEWFKEWSSYITECDLAIVEGSHPSTIHIGFEIGMILAKNKPVILLYREEQDPVFINELYSSRLIKTSYNQNNLEDVLDWCFRELEHLINRRFAFYVSPDIENFLNKISAKKGISRAEFIRLLLEREMRKKQMDQLKS